MVNVYIPKMKMVKLQILTSLRRNGLVSLRNSEYFMLRGQCRDHSEVNILDGIQGRITNNSNNISTSGVLVRATNVSTIKIGIPERKD